MSRFSEQTFDNWRKPASETEEQKISNAISMIKEAIKSSEILRNKDIEIFVQGSYANNTNVRVKSDVDVCVMLKDTFFTEYPDGLSNTNYGFSEGAYSFSDYREQVEKALIDKYGKESVRLGNKSIKIESSSYRVKADVVPSFQYRNYKCLNSLDPGRFIEGVKFFASRRREEVVNYPKIHICNGKIKNSETQKRFKRLVRIFKRIRHKMSDEELPVNDGITSFLIECLLWNVPNDIYNYYDTWTERIEQAIYFLYRKTNQEKDCKEWCEVSDMFYLFHNGRKWNVKMVNTYLVQMWNYLGLKQ